VHNEWLVLVTAALSDITCLIRARVRVRLLDRIHESGAKNVGLRSDVLLQHLAPQATSLKAVGLGLSRCLHPRNGSTWVIRFEDLRHNGGAPLILLIRHSAVKRRRYVAYLPIHAVDECTRGGDAVGEVDGDRPGTIASGIGRASRGNARRIGDSHSRGVRRRGRCRRTRLFVCRGRRDRRLVQLDLVNRKEPEDVVYIQPHQLTVAARHHLRALPFLGDLSVDQHTLSGAIILTRRPGDTLTKRLSQPRLRYHLDHGGASLPYGFEALAMIQKVRGLDRHSGIYTKHERLRRDTGPASRLVHGSNSQGERKIHRDAWAVHADDTEALPQHHVVTFAGNE